MQDDELLRYSRHILMDEIGIEGQDRLAAAHALVVGAGGLGSPVAMYLAAAGVGHITLIDPDTVDLTNLQRQTLHTTERVGLPKVASAAHALRELNPHVQVSALQMHADERTLPDLVQQADVVLDCTDNFKTRHAINIACVHHGKPLVSGAAIRWDGQISVFDTRTTHGPCYACAFPANEQPEETRCSTMGVFAPLVGIIGAMQAAEALKLLLQLQPSLAGRLLMLQGRAMEWTEVRLARQPHCVVCSGC